MGCSGAAGAGPAVAPAADSPEPRIEPTALGAVVTGRGGPGREGLGSGAATPTVGAGEGRPAAVAEGAPSAASATRAATAHLPARCRVRFMRTLDPPYVIVPLLPNPPIRFRTGGGFRIAAVRTLIT